MTLLFLNLHYNEVCYKGTVLLPVLNSMAAEKLLGSP